MALAADIHFQDVPLFGGARLEGGAASADYRHFVILGMYIGFHASHLAVCVLSALPFPIQMLSHYTAFFPPRQLFLREFAKNSCKFAANALY
mgnify:FL=1